MKNIFLLSLLIMASSIGMCQKFEKKEIPYGKQSPVAVNVLKADQHDNILIGAEDQWNKQAIVQSVSSNGKINWEFPIVEDSAGSVVGTEIEDISSTENGVYVLCTNHFATTSNPKTYSTLYTINKAGEMVHREDILIPKNDYRGQSLVQKCWEESGKIYILGTIFEGANFQPKENPGSIYWLQVVDRDYRPVSGLFFPSGIPLRAIVKDAASMQQFIFLVAANGIGSELTRINKVTGEKSQIELKGQARMLSADDTIIILSAIDNEYVLIKFDKSLKMLASKKIPINQEEIYLSAFTAKDGSVEILTSTLHGTRSELHIRKFDKDFEENAFEKIGTWSPAANFSRDSAQLINGDRVVQFSQRIHDKEVKFFNNLLVVKIQ